MPLRVIRDVIARRARSARRADRARGPDPRARDRGARDRARVAQRRARRPTTCRTTCSTGSRSSACSRPTPRGYDADDVAIIEAISRFRAGGYDEAIGFTVYDTLRYREALEPLVEEEVRVLLDRLAGKVDVDRAVEIISSGAEPLRELIGAMHSKLLLAALRRHAAWRKADPYSGMLDVKRRYFTSFASSILTTRRRGPPSRRSPRPSAIPSGQRRRRTCRTAGGSGCARAAGSGSLRARPRDGSVKLVDGRADRRRTARRASLGSPSIQTVRSLSVGGSLTPLTRFQATARPSLRGADARRPPPARVPRVVAGGVVDHRVAVDRQRPAVDRDRPVRADAALLARPRVRLAGRADRLDAGDLVERELDCERRRRAGVTPPAHSAQRPRPSTVRSCSRCAARSHTAQNAWRARPDPHGRRRTASAPVRRRRRSARPSAAAQAVPRRASAAGGSGTCASSGGRASPNRAAVGKSCGGYPCAYRLD